MRVRIIMDSGEESVLHLSAADLLALTAEVEEMQEFKRRENLTGDFTAADELNYGVKVHLNRLAAKHKKVETPAVAAAGESRSK